MLKLFYLLVALAIVQYSHATNTSIKQNSQRSKGIFIADRGSTEKGAHSTKKAMGLLKEKLSKKLTVKPSSSNFIMPIVKKDESQNQVNDKEFMEKHNKEMQDKQKETNKKTQEDQEKTNKELKQKQNNNSDKDESQNKVNDKEYMDKNNKEMQDKQNETNKKTQEDQEKINNELKQKKNSGIINVSSILLSNIAVCFVAIIVHIGF
ncbi:hypothetical protein BB561_000046 [Smittium simulii]|uniref:Uncharacterized protein n=1 Tax=Smittium simulii TaxID=133385 RepID=A0A2T9Z0S3_9FUNG|nr:hypothetical protein BB561_000046 [Smittium simulii]